MSESIAEPPTWDIQAARNLYNVHRWGAKYFDINDAGEVEMDGFEQLLSPRTKIAAFAHVSDPRRTGAGARAFSARE